MLFWVPADTAVTFTEKVHEALAASVAPVRLTVPVDPVAVIVPPPQEPVSPFGVATVKPAGRLSLNPTPLSAVVVFTFVSVKESDVEPLNGMLDAPKALVIVGGPTTVRLAFAVLLVPALVVVGVTLLFLTPAAVPLTSTEMAHDASGARGCDMQNSGSGRDRVSDKHTRLCRTKKTAIYRIKTLNCIRSICAIDS